MIKFRGYEINETNLFRRRVKCTIEEFILLTELCADINEKEITYKEFIHKYPNFTLSYYVDSHKDIIITIGDDWTWGWDVIDLGSEHIEFSEVAKPVSSENTDDSISMGNVVAIKQGTIVKATRNNGDNPPFIWQGVYFGYCNDKHLIDFNGTHCMVADKVVVVPTLSKKEAKQKVSELFANNGKNVSSQKIREIIDLIEFDGCNKEEK